MSEATAIDHVEYDGIATKDPIANAATRSNIVSAGPGSVETFLAFEPDPDEDE